MTNEMIKNFWRFWIFLDTLPEDAFKRPDIQQAVNEFNQLACEYDKFFQSINTISVSKPKTV